MCKTRVLKILFYRGWCSSMGAVCCWIMELYSWYARNLNFLPFFLWNCATIAQSTYWYSKLLYANVAWMCDDDVVSRLPLLSKCTQNVWFSSEYQVLLWSHCADVQGVKFCQVKVQEKGKLKRTFWLQENYMVRWACEKQDEVRNDWFRQKGDCIGTYQLSESTISCWACHADSSSHLLGTITSYKTWYDCTGDLLSGIMPSTATDEHAIYNCTCSCYYRGKGSLWCSFYLIMQGTIGTTATHDCSR
jgi:hypothetical protein